MSTEKRKTEVTPQPERGDRGEIIPPNKIKLKVTQSCATVRVAKKYPDHPRPRAGGERQDEKEKNSKHRQSCATIEWPGYPGHSPALSGEL